MAFWTMSRLAMRSGAMFTAASVMKSVSRMGRHVHDEDVADAPARAQPRLALGDRAEQLVGMQAALHQQLGFARRARARPPSRPRPGCAAHRRSRARRYRARAFRRRSRSCPCGPTRIGMIIPACGGLERTAQRALIAGMRDGRRQAARVLASPRSAARTSRAGVVARLRPSWSWHRSLLRGRCAGGCHHFRYSAASPACRPGKLMISAWSL